MLCSRTSMYKLSFLIEHQSLMIFISIVFLFFSLSFSISKAESIDENAFQVLVLHSYNNGYSWTDSINKGITEHFSNNQEIEYFIDYLDLKRNVSEIYKKKLIDLLQDKYQGKKYDVVIVSDDPGFDLVIKNQELLFPNTPIVFCGLNKSHPNDAIKYGNMSGVIEEFSIIDTLELIKKLHPNRKKIIWIGDDFTLSEKMFIELFKDAIKNYKSDFEYEYWLNISEHELIERLKHKDDTVTFLTAFVMKNNSGQYLTIEQGSLYLSKHTDCPIYTIWDMQVGYGAIGGKVTSGETQGRIAAQIAQKIVKNPELNKVPIIESFKANVFMFDYLQLRRFKIRESQLPTGSIIINKPFSFYKKYKHQIWLIILSFVILTLTIIYLYSYIFSRRLAIKQLSIQKDFLRSMLINLPIDFWAQDKEGNIIAQSELSKKLWGDCYGSSFEYAIKDLDYLKAQSNSNKLAANGETVFNETCIRIRDEQFYFYNITAPIISNSGITGIIGINQDITAHKTAELEILRKTDEVNKINQDLKDIINESKTLNENLKKSQAELLISYRILRDSEKRFKELIDNMSEGYVIIDLKGNFVFSNPAAESIFGINEGELLNRNLNQFMSLQDTQLLLSESNKGPEVKTKHIEVEIQTPHGLGKSLLVSVAPNFDNQSNNTGANILFIDITQRKAAEKAALENEAKLYSLISQIHAQIWTTDLDLKITYYLGSNFKSRYEFYNSFNKKLITEVIPKTEFTPDLENAHINALKGIPVEMMVKIDNQTFNFYFEPLRDIAGQITGVIGIAFDISELVKTREKLEDIDNLLKQAEKISKIGSWIYDVQNNQLIGSEMLYKISNLPENVLLKLEDILARIHTDDQDEFLDAYKGLLNKDVISAEGEYRLLIDEQSYIDTIIKAKSVLNEQGEVVKLIGSLQDMTERRQIEEARLKMRNLETLSTLASGIAHDFNNYLTVIGTHADELFYEIEVKSKDELLDSLNTIKRYVKTSTGLTQQLLTFARGSKPVKKITNLSSLVFTAAQFAAHGSNLKILFDISREYFINADENQIGGQVINNLVINAKQARATELRISMQSFINQATQSEYIKVIFSDNGTGINKEIIKKIFDPYFTTKREGSGLGLAICRSILSNHDGDIYIQNTSESGTTFVFVLPLIKESEKSVDKQEEQVGKFRKLKILIMDDEETVRYVLARMIIKLGHDVTITSNEVEAVDAYNRGFINQEPYDLSILDLTLVGRNATGEDVLREIRKINPNALVVVSSGYAYQMDIIPDVTFNAALNKPYYINDLSDVIYQLIYSKENSSEA